MPISATRPKVAVSAKGDPNVVTDKGPGVAVIKSIKKSHDSSKKQKQVAAVYQFKSLIVYRGFLKHQTCEMDD